LVVLAVNKIVYSKRQIDCHKNAINLPFTCIVYNNWYNKRAQRALGRSPEDKVKGHSGANNRKPQGHYLNNFGKGPLDDIIY